MGPGGPFRAAGCALLVPVPSSPFEPFKILLLRHRPRPLRLQPRRGWSSRHICSHAARRVQYTVQPNSVICVVRFRALVAAHSIAESVRQPAGRRGATRQLPLVAHDRATSERPRLSALGDSGDSVTQTVRPSAVLVRSSGFVPEFGSKIDPRSNLGW
jgi:hypothetical protein